MSFKCVKSIKTDEDVDILAHTLSSVTPNLTCNQIKVF